MERVDIEKLKAMLRVWDMFKGVNQAFDVCEYLSDCLIRKPEALTDEDVKELDEIVDQIEQEGILFEDR